MGKNTSELTKEKRNLSRLVRKQTVITLLCLIEQKGITKERKTHRCLVIIKVAPRIPVFVLIVGMITGIFITRESGVFKMKLVELSKVVEMYEKKVKSKEPYFGYYFLEESLDIKLQRVRALKEALGDIKIREDHLKMFLYSGYRHSYGEKIPEELTVSKIKHIYPLMVRHPKLSLRALDTIVYYYDEECFETFDIGSEFDRLVEEYGYEDELVRYYWRLIDSKRDEIRDFYKMESKKLEYLKEEYGKDFIRQIQEAMEKKHVTAEVAISLIPSKAFIDASRVWVPLGYSITSGEDVVVRTILGHTDPYSGSDDKPIYLGPCSTGDSVYTSFTKKEYFDELKRHDRIKTKRR